MRPPVRPAVPERPTGVPATAARPPRRVPVDLAVVALVALLLVLVAGLAPGADARFTATTGNAGNVLRSGTWGAGSLSFVGLAGRGQGGTVDVTPTWSLAPAQVLGTTAWSWVGVGVDHTCARRDSDSTLHCWGRNSRGQLGNGTTASSLVPVAVTVPAGVVLPWTALAVGGHHACAIDSATVRQIWCWGAGDAGQAGGNLLTDALVPRVLSTSVVGWETISAGFENTCAQLTDPKSIQVRCWGGPSSINGKNSTESTPQAVKTDHFAAVAVGRETACAIRSADRTLWCWGRNRYGQLGNGTTTRTGVPAAVTGAAAGSAWTAVSVGDEHACAVRTDGTLWCTGSNRSGQLGTGTRASTTTFVQVGASTAWTGVTVGGRSSCALRGTALWCWGADDRGQLGLAGPSGAAHADVVPTPTAVAGTWSRAQLGSSRLCAVASPGGTVACAGDDEHGGLGRGTTTLAAAFADPAATPPVRPRTVAAGGPWSTVAAGTSAACGVGTGGALRCWGSNAHGQLGLGDTVARATPTQVGTATTWSAVSVGGRHACAVDTGARLFCWGRGVEGQVGTGAGSVLAPVQVAAGTPWRQVSTGFDHTCAVAVAGTLWCWGAGESGQLGVGDLAGRAALTQVGALTTWSAVSAGALHTCGTLTSGTLWCWGAGGSGQLGRGSTSDATAPAQVGTATTWSAVRAGGAHTCALTTGGSLSCWGANGRGQVGNNATVQADALAANVTSPVVVQTGVASVALGDEHTCVLRTDASVSCWGDNAAGQLGTPALYSKWDVTWTSTPTPLQVGHPVATVAAGGAVTLLVRAP